MASPSGSAAANDNREMVLAGPSADGNVDAMSSIPRRLMRVKVLYTFDDENKSNCLARLPNALNIPTVSLDETTQIGVIELKSCIQAITAASPELVAKLGHDYTVYAYDYSEYDTPLVGQGMLSWILASASSTPNVPAHESQTMVTGRVCNNILGLFSNGIKETLEVKLKLVPVPTCMQKEYVENMERYHSLSKLMPQGLDYSAWAEFLKSNPAIGQLANPVPQDAPQKNLQSPMGGVESFHQMLTRPSAEWDPRNNMYVDQRGVPLNIQPRPSSPALSTASYNLYSATQGSRPASRASFRSESGPQTFPYPPYMGQSQEQPEEGPPKKRARVTKARRPKKATLAANNDSLRVTASTAASVRLHRPIAANPGSAVASIEQIPRAPTPRPGNPNMAQPVGLRPGPARSLLRNASMDEGQTPLASYESGIFSDTAMESADDERGISPGETPMDIPSSPPLMPQRFVSSAPSSPGLPALPNPLDSGFVSDMATGREDDLHAGVRAWEESDLPCASDAKFRRPSTVTQQSWTEVTPGPVELLPKSYIPKPKTYPRPRPTPSTAQSIQTLPEETQLAKPGLSSGSLNVANQPRNVSPRNPAGAPSTTPQFSDAREALASELRRSSTSNIDPALTRSDVRGELPPQKPEGEQEPINPALPETSMQLIPSYNGDEGPNPNDRATTPQTTSKPTTSRARGLPRSQTWSGEQFSDAACPTDGNGKQPRSGSGAKRKQNIKSKLEASLAAGEMPTFCNNCGEIETPTWRKAYTRVEYGDPSHIQVSSDGTAIVAYEIIEDNNPQYRIFKQALEPGEKDGNSFTTLTLCNPCGLWLTKKNSIRPSQFWAKPKPIPGEKPKRRRAPPKGARKKQKDDTDLTSDAIVPHSEPMYPCANDVSTMDGPFDSNMDHGLSNYQDPHRGSHLDEGMANAALQRAIQSSPVGVRGSKESPINLEPDLTPKPTRRLLFPSPRKDGETKSLQDAQSAVSPSNSAPRLLAEPPARIPDLPDLDFEDTDKENCPPSASHHDDDLAHLFGDSLSTKTTPTKSALFQDLLKTPTPGSRHRRPKQDTDTFDPLLSTPSRHLTTPRSTRAATTAPETPFTRQLNALLSDCQPSPSQAIDFSAFPTFNTPGRNNSGALMFDFAQDDLLSSDFPMPSSPPGGPGFALYEDPETRTVGLWSGASIFQGSDAVDGDGAGGEEQERQDDEMDEGEGDVKTGLKINGLQLDFTTMIEGVVGKRMEEQTSETSLSSERTNKTYVEAASAVI
ncbi:hypothetical protein P154DRAFT_482976 [Amniculicola lignicola CBS 123094]|uniref:Ams2/SPT21 N-terminal domain-containing protein n=1 Tax=Amniculicola lignicola CBS 123094 TaxID=1392246 RepID=A0A6A5WX74_9PLEO|nr:hypothetical protein P154DRAFT_482976 [Amniculicola lignicola CBS 123094]